MNINDDKFRCEHYHHIFSFLTKNNKKDMTTSSYSNDFNYWLGNYYDEEHYLHTFCNKGSVESVQRLLKFGLNVNIKNKNGDTPLHVVCNKIIKQKNKKYFNILNIINILIDKGAYINSKDELGRTPMHLVCITGFLDGADALLKNGANMNIMVKKNLKNSFGDSDYGTPFYYACSKGHSEMVNMLLEKIPTKNLNLEIMIKYCILSFSISNSEKIAIALLDKIEDVNFTDEENNTTLHWACVSNFKELINILLEKKANINAMNNDGQTPLYYACMLGHSDVFKMLLDKGADVHITDKWGNTPLHKACCNKKDDEIVGTLLKYKSDINAKNNEGNTPLHSFFCDNSITCDISQSKKVLIMLLNNKDVNVNTINNDGRTPLHLVCYISFGYTQDEDIEIVKILLDKGTDINIEDNHLHNATYCANNNRKRYLVKILNEDKRYEDEQDFFFGLRFLYLQ